MLLLAERFRDALILRPGVVPALRSGRLLGPNARAIASAGLRALLDAGHPPEVAVPGYLLLVDFILGVVYFDNGGSKGVAAPPDSWSSDTLSDHAEEFHDVDREQVFRICIRSFLAGLEAESGYEKISQ